MCTAISFKTKDHYFGRNLDLEYRYDERVVVTPRNYPLDFRRAPYMERHYALIGMATVAGDYPLYYEATNERGLSMAGLNFPGNAHYPPEEAGRDNIAPFEFIPWILGQCASVAEARPLLARINLASIPFSEALPLSPLHWIICDRNESIAVEPMPDGLRIHNNPIGVLTNNPPFDYQMTHLADYMGLSHAQPQNTFAPGVPLAPYSRGMGALGLPGDCSSASRFVRAAFTKAHSVCGEAEFESISQFFHILSSVRHVRGSVEVGGRFEITLYSSCCNTDTGVYYYTTYENSRISAVDMRREDLSTKDLIVYPLLAAQDIRMQN